tara:strand:- start:1918 stop:2328 length:411 start_codon:yes stop_codon:yes gene_type:complete
MGKISILLFAFIFIFLGLSCQQSRKMNTEKQPSFNGVWSDSSNVNFSNCYAVFSTIEDSIHMGHYIEYKGQPFFETGSGIIKGDSIIYHVDVIHMIPEWGPDGGTHYLKLSADKNTLEGVFITDSGHKGPLVFKRR